MTMGERGRIVQIKGNTAVVSMTRGEACGHCKACETGKPHLLEVPNSCDGKVNDWVSIELQGNDFIKATAILYGLPLMLFLVGIGAGYFFAPLLNIDNVELLSFLTGITFALLSHFIMKKMDKMRRSNDFIPVIRKIG